MKPQAGSEQPNAKAFDRELATSLVVEHNSTLVRVLSSRGIFGEHAEEILQETWNAFFEAWDRFEGRSQVRTFVCGILINKIREHRRAQARFVDIGETEAEFEAMFTDEGWWKKDPVQPDALLDSTQTLTAIDDCMKRLSEEQHTAFYLKEVEGYEYEEICKILGLSNTNVGVVLFRARTKLRSCLEKKAIQGAKE